MNQELLITYLINFIFTIIKALTFTAGCFLAWRVFDMMDITDIRKEITENKNIGWAVMMAALFGGLAYVIGQI